MSLSSLRAVPHYLIPQQALTAFAGCMAGVKRPAIKNYLIQNFIAKYNVNMSEALIEDPTAYSCFNDFFIRQLKPGCRPLAKADLVSPVDGCVSEIGVIKEGQLLQAKGHYYSVEELLACSKDKAAQFIHGRFATLYLSPKDYHRVHMPLDAKLISMSYIPGALFSVQPSTAQVIPKLFARNERLAIFFETSIGLMAMVLVGATIVGSIGTSWHGDIKREKKNKQFDYTQEKQEKILAKGAEMGFFKLGSTVVLLFAEGSKVAWEASLAAGTSIRFGEKMGDIISIDGTEKRT